MVQVNVLTLFPLFFSGMLQTSIVQRALTKDRLAVALHDWREFASPPRRQVDDYLYGGGAGMLLMAEPIARCIDKIVDTQPQDEIIFLTPDAPVLTQKDLNYLSTLSNISMICGKYKGLDQRIRDTYVTREISIGNYVLSGGEPAAAVLIDGIARLLPGVLGDETAALDDSFQNNSLDPPHYTRPRVWRDMEVPEELVSGNPSIVEEWKEAQSLEKTRRLYPELLD